MGRHSRAGKESSPAFAMRSPLSNSRRRSLTFRTLAFAVAVSLAGSTGAQTPGVLGAQHPGVIDGIVTDSAVAPLGDVTVSILGSSIRVVTGSDGRFRVRDLTPGSYTLIARRIGFEAGALRVDLSPSDTIRSSFALQRLATALDTIRVHSRDLTGFAWRRSLNVGQFITAADIERENPRSTTSLIRTRDAMRYTFDQGGHPFVAMTAGPGRVCQPLMLLDGFPIPGGSAPSVTGVPTLDWSLHPGEIGGVEIYVNPAQVPAQFASFKSPWDPCGVIVFWTRERLGIPSNMQVVRP